MNFTEITILLLLLVMTVPDFCRRIGRPALTYAVYLLCGMLINPFLDLDIRQALRTVGEIGFILLLFEIGLEVDIPRLKTMITPFRRATAWILLQVPVLLFVAMTCGFPLTVSLIAVAGFCGCSVGMAFQGWYHYPLHPRQAKADFLYWMILLEVIAMIVLSAGGALLGNGLGFGLLLSISGIILTIALIAVFGDTLARRVAYFSRSTLRWRAHFWILFVLAAVSIARRLGLPPPKAAFFLGLAISRTTHEGLALEHHLRPIGQHLLIPVFFLSLGASTQPAAWFSITGWHALLTAAIILLLRRLITRPILQEAGGPYPHWIASPNLTIAAVAAEVLSQANVPHGPIAWLLMSSTLVTLYAILAQPSLPEPNPANHPLEAASPDTANPKVPRLQA